MGSHHAQKARELRKVDRRSGIQASPVTRMARNGERQDVRGDNQIISGETSFKEAALIIEEKAGVNRRPFAS